MPPATRKPKDAYHHGDLRPALIAAALRIIEKDGPAALTLRGVARRVGVSPAAPYHHFPDKEAILAAVAEEGFVKLLAAMEGEQATDRSARARLCASGISYVRFAAQHPSHYRVMFAGHKDESQHASLHLAAMRTFSFLVETIREAQAGGSVREGVPEELACLAWSTVHGLALLHIEGKLGTADCTPVAIEPFAEAAVGMIARGLAPG